jgi:hypothetical protein
VNRNARRQAHDLKRAGGILGRVASGNHLAAQNDEPEPDAAARAEAFHRDNDRKALELQVQANMRDPLTRGAY